MARNPSGKTVELNLTPELRLHWDALQLVIEGLVSMSELQTLTFDDIDLLCMARDAYRDAERESNHE